MPGGYATMDSICNKDEGLDEDEDRRSGDSNEYYAGGAGLHGGSGLSILGPSRNGSESRDGDNSRGEPVNDIFRVAQSHQGGELDSNSQSFSHTITMYHSGFTVGDGPYRRLDDPVNASFLESLASGIVPRELEQEIQEGSVSGSYHQVKLVDKRGQEYTPPPQPSYVAFSGEGQTMGGGTIQEDGVVSASTNEEVPMPVLDESQPVTTLQIRLKNGRCIRQQLNTSHTLRHVQKLGELVSKRSKSPQAIISNEGSGDSPYILMAGYPPSQITNYSQTLQEAGLLNAQIVQKPC